MAQFSYRAREKTGALAQGMIEAANANEARSKVAAKGLIPIQITQQSKLNMNFNFSFGGGSVKAEELVLFTKQFATLFKAGMGMESILSTLAKQSKNKLLIGTLSQIQQDIREGSSLSRAFAKHPKVFDGLYINMLASGEEAGILEEVLEHLAVLLEKDFTMRKNIKSAMLYPKIVVGVLVMAVVVIMTFVVPKFQSLFSQFGAELPLPTRILIGTSNFFQSYIILIAIGVGVLVFLYKRFYATMRGRFLVDRLAFKIPVFGLLAYKVCNARFASIMASLYRSGLSVTKGLEITGATIGNEAFMRDIKILQADVEKGASISDSMRKLNYFSPIMIEATNIGEKTGSLDSMLKSISEHYDMEVGHMVKNLTTLIEPILLVCIFSMVALFALAIFLPMWNLSEHLTK